MKLNLPGVEILRVGASIFLYSPQRRWMRLSCLNSSNFSADFWPNLPGTTTRNRQNLASSALSDSSRLGFLMALCIFTCGDSNAGIGADNLGSSSSSPKVQNSEYPYCTMLHASADTCGDNNAGMGAYNLGSSFSSPKV